MSKQEDGIECIVEDDSSSSLKKEDHGDDDFGEDFSERDRAASSFFEERQNMGRHRNSKPVIKMYYGKKYVVGMISKQEQYMENTEEDRPIHYYPPKLILLNFPRPHNYNAQTQLLLIENSQFGARMEEMNKQDQDLTTYLEQLVVGSSLNLEEKLGARKFWFRQFFEFAQRYPPCCKRVKKFWEWVFMLNPESNFKWRFRAFTLQWIELMTSYVEFRELFSLWIESFEAEVLVEIQADKKRAFNAQLYARYLKELMQMKNKSNPSSEDVELRPDMLNEVLNNGVILKPDGYKDSCICKKSERDLRIGLIPKLNKIQLKSEMKLFNKQQSAAQLQTLFQFSEVEQQQQYEYEEYDGEAYNENDGDEGGEENEDEGEEEDGDEVQDEIDSFEDQDKHQQTDLKPDTLNQEIKLENQNEISSLDNKQNQELVGSSQKEPQSLGQQGHLTQQVEVIEEQPQENVQGQ